METAYHASLERPYVEQDEGVEPTLFWFVARGFSIKLILLTFGLLTITLSTPATDAELDSNQYLRTTGVSTVSNRVVSLHRAVHHLNASNTILDAVFRVELKIEVSKTSVLRYYTIRQFCTSCSKYSANPIVRMDGNDPPTGAFQALALPFELHPHCEPRHVIETCSSVYKTEVFPLKLHRHF